MKISNNHLAPLIQCICFSSSQQSIEWHCGWPWSCTGWNVWSFWNYYFTGLSFHVFHVVEYNETQVSYCISNCSKVVVAVVNSYISSKTLLLDSVMAVMSQQSIESLLTSGIRLVKNENMWTRIHFHRAIVFAWKHNTIFNAFYFLIINVLRLKER